MNRRNFLKAMFSLPVALGIPETKLLRLATGTRHPTKLSRGTRTGWINLNEVDEEQLANWWADLNEFKLPKEFGEIPEGVNPKDYLRGAFKILNAFTPEEAANQAWLRKMAPYLEEWERQKPTEGFSTCWANPCLRTRPLRKLVRDKECFRANQD